MKIAAKLHLQNAIIVMYDALHVKKKMSENLEILVFFQLCLVRQYLHVDQRVWCSQKKKKFYHNILATSDRGKQIWRNDINLRDPSFSLYPALNFNSNEFACGIMIASLKRVHQTIKKRVLFLESFSKLIQETTCEVFTKKIKNMSPFFCPIIVNRTDITAENYAKILMSKGVTLLPKYGCVISEWRFAKKYIKNFKSKNAINFRNSSFNLLLNENYNEKVAQEFARVIKNTDSTI